MPSVIGFRNTIPASPFRFCYGIRDGVLLFPLDLSFTNFNPDTPDPSGTFIGSQVTGAGFLIGTINNYVWPPLGLVNPLVEVTPDPGFPIGGITALPPLPLAIIPNNTSVTVDLNGTVVNGIALAFANTSYIDAVHQVNAYIVQFDVPLLPDHHGAPVFLAANPATIIGMITSTQRISNAPNTLVCPV